MVKSLNQNMAVMPDSKLTKNWSKYDPKAGYEKEMQDVQLKNGDIITMCWPNAGFGHCTKRIGNEKYYGKEDISVDDTAFVRLTNDPIY